MNQSVVLVVALFLANSFYAQTEIGFRIHSHNDYLQNIPFWKAFAAGATSVEADVYLVNDSLFVAHTKEEIDRGRDIENLYLQPIQKSIKMKLGFNQPFQLLIDSKSEPYSTLAAIVKLLEKYPEIIADENISIVITGKQPKPSEFTDYPSYISFDYQSLEAVENPSVLNKIGLISLSFKKFSNWNGKGRLTTEDFEKVSSTIKKAHALGKPFRFWATPDSKTAWKALTDLGIDFVNTDMPFECVHYLKSLKLHKP